MSQKYTECLQNSSCCPEGLSKQHITLWLFENQVQSRSLCSFQEKWAKEKGNMILFLENMVKTRLYIDSRLNQNNRRQRKWNNNLGTWEKISVELWYGHSKWKVNTHSLWGETEVECWRHINMIVSLCLKHLSAVHSTHSKIWASHSDVSACGIPVYYLSNFIP